MFQLLWHEAMKSQSLDPVHLGLHLNWTVEVNFVIEQVTECSCWPHSLGPDEEHDTSPSYRQGKISRLRRGNVFALSLRRCGRRTTSRLILNEWKKGMRADTETGLMRAKPQLLYNLFLALQMQPVGDHCRQNT